MAGHVFISYSRSDIAYVDRLAARLVDAGVPVWIDHKIDYGDRWTSVIESQLETCAAIVPVMTPDSARSEWVDREINFAEQLGKPILPLLLSGRPFFRLSTVQYEDVTAGAMPDAAFVDRLLVLVGSPDRQLIIETDEETIYALAYSPDGRRLATGGTGGNVQIRTTTSGDVVRVITGHTGPVADLAFSPDGRLLASASQDKTAKIWEASTGSLLHSLDADDVVVSVAFSPDGIHLVRGSYDGTIQVWDAATGALRRVLEDPEETLQAVAYSPDGRHIASAGYDGAVRIWDAEAGTMLRTFTTGEPYGDLLSSVVYSVDGLVAAAGFETVRIWDPADGTLVNSVATTADDVDSLAFSPDGRRILGGTSSGRIHVWDIAKGTLMRTLTGHEGAIHSIVFSPSGRVLASGGQDGTVRLWGILIG